MTESSTIEAPTLSQDTLDRLAELRRQRRAITHEIKEILGSVIADIVARPTVECLRCGFSWTPHSPAIRPRACARCVTTAWDKPPTATSRKPSDPPSPSWRVRTGERRPRMQPERKRIRYRRTREQVELDEAEKIAELVARAATAKEEFLSSAKDRISTLVASERTREQDISNAINKFRVPPPPRISAILPPPPSPSLSHAPSQTLSAWLRDVVIEDGKSEPQPERVSSHAAPTMPEPPEPPPVENPVETVEDSPAPSEAEIIEDDLSTLDIPPEQVGAPRADAEREELERARFEVWPTTRGDD